jgi:hypothetical protein
MYVKALTFGSGVRSHTILGMRSHHAGVTGSGKSARRIASQIAETLPRGAKVPVSQGLFVVQRSREQGDASVLGMKYRLMRGDGRSANPMPFQLLRQSDIIDVAWTGAC